MDRGTLMDISLDIEELACAACGKNEDEAEQIIEDNAVADMVFDRYGVDIETYAAIVKDLLPLTPIVTTGFQGKRVHAFVRGDACILKQEAG